jgi:L-ascorbate metabolism protein UlaG (beta-lactamase superfamily)
MQRRQILKYGGIGLLSFLAPSTVLAQTKPPAQPKADNSLLIEWLGHTCFLLTGSGRRILVNPFRSLGCTAQYPPPKVAADIVLISSQLWDEGAVQDLLGNPKILFEAGTYDLNGFKLQGVAIAHDRRGGKQFGMNIAWRWNQGGLKVVHLGGAAAKIEIEQKILLGSPDVAFVPVGGSDKAYNAQEALKALQVLNPRVFIPTHYLSAAADKANCDLVGVDEFLKLVSDKNIRRLDSNQLRISAANLPKQGTLIRVFNDTPLLQTSEEAKK